MKKYVADELLWRKAKKLQYDQDPEVTRRLEEAGKQLAVGLFLEREVASQITTKEPDLKTYFEANKVRYDEKGEGVSFEKVKDRVDQEKAATTWPTLDNGAKVEPNVFDLNFSEEMPILNINLTGDYPVQQLKEYGEYLQDKIELLWE